MEPVVDQPDPHSPMSLPGEPQFTIAPADVGAGAQWVLIQIAVPGGVTIQVAIRPELALTVARLIGEKAKVAKSGLIIPSAQVPSHLNGRNDG